MKCTIYGKRGSLNRRLNGYLGNGIVNMYSLVLIFEFSGINDIKYTLIVFIEFVLMANFLGI